MHKIRKNIPKNSHQVRFEVGGRPQHVADRPQGQVATPEGAPLAGLRGEPEPGHHGRSAEQLL